MSPLSQPDAALRADPDYAETDDTADEERPAARPARSGRTREGLPAAYRMRHAPHYVEQLMGDAPIQTIRQVSIDHIDRAGGVVSADAPLGTARLPEGGMASAIRSPVFDWVVSFSIASFAVSGAWLVSAEHARTH